jgi:hypothetical protein
MKTKKKKSKPYPQTNQSRICDCWMDVGQCYCDIETKKEEDGKIR